ncbi:tyrosine-type recombinase/integrase [Candidatus Woesearchaeota archaeon]|nr:tyrosine-type recombinase/integrase [Candidatus Woesearchaeota archaeon]
MKNEEVLEKIERELKLQGKSPSTIKSYLIYLQNLFDFSGKIHSRILFEDIKKFLEYLSIEKNYSSSSMTLAKSAISFYYEGMLEKYPIHKIRTKKKEERLPVILTKEEVIRIIDAAANLRDKLIVQLMYTCGLRVSEAVNMKLENLDLNDMTGTIRKSKGNKDRSILLSPKLIDNLQIYIRSKTTPSIFLFSKSNGLQYTTRSFQLIIKGLAEKAGIEKRVHSHIFRHAFGTHSIEDGEDIVSLQDMMGHKSLDTTRLYITLSKKHLKGKKTPLDRLYEERK